MSNYRNTPDLLDETLNFAGELAASAYRTDALRFLNMAYQGLISGGSEFGLDISDAWSWAMAKKPLILKLLPRQTGTAIFVNGSSGGTFTTAPVLSMAGRVITFDSPDDYYYITAHTAGQANFILDDAWASSSGTFSYEASAYDYELVDDRITIDSSNNRVDFLEGALPFTAILESGIYTPVSFAAHVSTQMMLVGSFTYDHSYDSVLRQFLWEGSSAFSLLLGSGENAQVSPAEVMGLDVADYSGASLYPATYTLNAINRLVAPMQIGFSSYVGDPEQGFIYETDYNSFVRERMGDKRNWSAPTHYAVVRTQSNGTMHIRFDSAPSDKTLRVEVPYIPYKQVLTDYAASVPAVPYSFREYLVFAATFMLKSLKHDSEADKYAALAKSKLEALKNYNRKSLSLAGSNFGRVLPRKTKGRSPSWSRSY